MAALPSGTVVACGVKDEAMSNMSAAAKDAMKSCASSLATELSFLLVLDPKRLDGHYDVQLLYSSICWEFDLSIHIYFKVYIH